MERQESPDVVLTIQATFGSDIQRDVAIKVLDQFLEAWKENVESAHKMNKVTISRSDDCTSQPMAEG
jgi:hypothetical protein